MTLLMGLFGTVSAFATVVHQLSANGGSINTDGQRYFSLIGTCFFMA